jgi:hypothetical protein
VSGKRYADRVMTHDLRMTVVVEHDVMCRGGMESWYGGLLGGGVGGNWFGARGVRVNTNTPR